MNKEQEKKFLLFLKEKFDVPIEYLGDFFKKNFFDEIGEGEPRVELELGNFFQLLARTWRTEAFRMRVSQVIPDKEGFRWIVQATRYADCDGWHIEAYPAHGGKVGTLGAV